MENKNLEIKVINSYGELMQAKPSDILYIKGSVEVVINPKEDYKNWASLQGINYDKEATYTVSLWGDSCRENEYTKKFSESGNELMPASYYKGANINSGKPLAEAIKNILKEKGLIK